MKKWIFWMLLSVNVLFFITLRWGSALTVDGNSSAAPVEINPDKIKIVSLNAISSVAPVSTVSAASAVGSATVANMPSLPVTPVKSSCMEWGEFSGADLSRAEKALGALKLGDRLKHRTVEYNNGYWVYMAPLKSRIEVEQKIAQLKGRGVTDYFIIQEAGPWQNAISLGVFKTEEAARKYLSKLQEQGVKTAQVGERASKLKFTVFALSRLEPAASSRIAALHKDFPDSEFKPVPCD